MAKKIPSYEYTGEHEARADDQHWYIYLKSSGSLTFGYEKKQIEACIVGGGAGGESDNGGTDGERGGNGGQVKNITKQVAAGTPYAIVVGAGGAAGIKGAFPGEGTASSAFGTSASGGTGASGGEGAGGTGQKGAAGSAGTYAFGDSSMPRYGGGGGGGAGAQTGENEKGAGGSGGGGRGAGGAGPYDPGDSAQNGAAHTGGGGGGEGGFYYDDEFADHRFDAAGGVAGAGGSGVVILRGTEEDLIPVFFNGTQLSAVMLNGRKAAGMIYDGVRLYARRLAQRTVSRLRSEKRRKRYALYGQGGNQKRRTECAQHA